MDSELPGWRAAAISGWTFFFLLLAANVLWACWQQICCVDIVPSGSTPAKVMASSSAGGAFSQRLFDRTAVIDLGATAASTASGAWGGTTMGGTAMGGTTMGGTTMGGGTQREGGMRVEDLDRDLEEPPPTSAKPREGDGSDHQEQQQEERQAEDDEGRGLRGGPPAAAPEEAAPAPAPVAAHIEI
jgi:hypothetical protein